MIACSTPYSIHSHFTCKVDDSMQHTPYSMHSHFTCKVDERVLGAIHNQFNNLDKKKTGHLDQGSMKEFQRQR
jgi:hypothetical protein